MLIEEIDHAGVETFQGGLSHGPDSFRLAVRTLTWYSVLESKLGCDHYFVANRGECLADEFFVGKRTVRFGGIEERYTAVIGGADYLDSVILFRRRAKAEA